MTVILMLTVLCSLAIDRGLEWPTVQDFTVFNSVPRLP
jgi:hypothetical protein